MLRQLKGARLADAVEDSYAQLGVSQRRRETIERILEPLKQHSESTYEHCLRVGVFARKIAEHLGLSSATQRRLLYAGLLHDCGKALTPIEILECTHDWTIGFQEVMKMHVLDGYEMVAPELPMAAAILLWHHRFQPDPYPEHFPRSRKRYSANMQAQIKYLGRLLALADFYDAAHRKNERDGDVRRVTDAAIKERMLEQNEDQRQLVSDLYDADIFRA